MSRKRPRIPGYIKDLLPPEIRVRVESSPFPSPGETLSSLRASSLLGGLDDFSEGLLVARENGVSFSIGTDGGIDSLAAAAIFRDLLVKFGAVERRGGQQDLFGGAGSGKTLSLDIGNGEILLSPGVGSRSLNARRADPPYPFPGLSLSGLALKVVSSLYRLGSLDYPSDFVAFDLETTGRDPKTDDIIEIGAVRVRGGMNIDEYSSLVKPPRGIPGEVVEITGITNSMVQNAPNLKEVLPDFLAFCGDMTLVAHNAPFDIAFLTRLARSSLEREIANNWEDTLVMSRWLYPEAESHRLGNIVKDLGISAANWHRAVADAEMVAGLYRKFIGAGDENLRELRVKQFLPPAALGTLGTGSFDDENGTIVAHGVVSSVRYFRLRDGDILPSPGEIIDDALVPEMLASLHDAERRQAALSLLRRVGR